MLVDVVDEAVRLFRSDWSVERFQVGDVALFGGRKGILLRLAAVQRLPRTDLDLCRCPFTVDQQVFDCWAGRSIKSRGRTLETLFLAHELGQERLVDKEELERFERSRRKYAVQRFVLVFVAVVVSRGVHSGRRIRSGLRLCLDLFRFSRAAAVARRPRRHGRRPPVASETERFESGAEAVAFLLTVLVFERDLALVVDVSRTVRVVADHPFGSRYRPCWSTGRADRARLDCRVGHRSMHHALGRSGLGYSISLGVNMAPDGRD